MKHVLCKCALVLVGSLLTSCYADGGPFGLQPYVDGGGNELTIQGDQVGTLRLRRGSLYLTGTTWKWEGATTFTFTPVTPTQPDVMQVEVRVKMPEPEFSVVEQGFVREYGPGGQPIIVKATGQPLQAPFTVHWQK